MHSRLDERGEGGKIASMNRALPLAAFVVALSVSWAGVCRAAVTIPYTNDFSGTAGNGAFETETTDAQWSVSGGKYVNSFAAAGGNASSASLQVSNAANTTFTMSTDFTVSAANGTTSSTYGFGFLGLNSTFSGGSTGAFYLADVTFAGTAQIRLVRVASSNTTLDSKTGATYQLGLDTTYSLKLSVTTTASSVSMTFGLYDQAGTQIGSSVTATDNTPLTGEYFGLRNRANAASGTHTASFDNFSIAPIPEPASFAMVAGGLVGAIVMMGRRRRVR